MKPDKKKVTDKKKVVEPKPKSGGGGLFIPNFEKKLKDSKGVVKKPKGKLARASKVRPFFLPPLNTNPDLSKLKKQKISKKKLARALVLPENYNLKDFYPIVVCGDRNDPTISQFQQYACGCCWAYAIATSISDVYVVQNKFLTNPNLSWTYILSCYPNNFNPGEGDFPPSAMCGGGDVPTTLLWVQNKGIASSMCVDYAWCLNDPNCTGTATDTKEMDKAVPSCGCYNSGNFYKYKIKDVRRISLDDSNDQNPEQILTIHSQMRQHLFVTGTMVGCFIVLENIVGVNPNSLITGDFKTSKNPEGVYLECVGVEEELKVEPPESGNDLDACIYKYENEEAVKPETPGEALGVLGAHAVCIVGWGMAPVSRTLVRPDIERLYPSLKPSDKDPSMVMVPYWWIRNSWGTSFAEKGFFKMAAYPFNRITCVDRTISIKTDGRSISAGGAVLFFPDQAIRDSFPENDQKGKTPLAKEGGGGGKGGVETGHFEGAKKGAELGEAVAYTQLSYQASDDVLPQVGTYQSATTLNPAQPQGEEKKADVITFPPDEGAVSGNTPSSPVAGKTNLMTLLGGMLIFLIIVAGGLFAFCKYAPDKCPAFIRSYLPSSMLRPVAKAPPSRIPVVTGVVIPPHPGLVPRVPTAVVAGAPIPPPRPGVVVVRKLGAPIPPPAAAPRPSVVVVRKLGVPIPPPATAPRPGVTVVRQLGVPIPPPATAAPRPGVTVVRQPGAPIPLPATAAPRLGVAVVRKPGVPIPPPATAAPRPGMAVVRKPGAPIPPRPSVAVVRKPGAPIPPRPGVAVVRKPRVPVPRFGDTKSRLSNNVKKPPSVRLSK